MLYPADLVIEELRGIARGTEIVIKRAREAMSSPEFIKRRQERLERLQAAIAIIEEGRIIGRARDQDLREGR